MFRQPPALDRCCRYGFCVLALALGLGSVASSRAEEIEPRRWSHLPVGSSFLGLGYSYTTADIFVDPVLELEDVGLDMSTIGLRYGHTFEAFERTARVGLLLPYQSGEWEGLLRGEPASTSRRGLADPTIRLSINLHGAPPLAGEEFVAYRRAQTSETIIGAGLVVGLPLGEYDGAKLINLGANRFVFRPQLGMVHTRGKLSLELTSSIWFYTGNDDFFGGRKRGQDPLITMQGHAIYNFQPGLWASASAAFGIGGGSTIDGVNQDDRTGDLYFALAVGRSLTRNTSVKLSWIRTQTQEDVGYDSDTIAVAYSVAW